MEGKTKGKPELGGDRFQLNWDVFFFTDPTSLGFSRVLLKLSDLSADPFLWTIINSFDSLFLQNISPPKPPKCPLPARWSTVHLLNYISRDRVERITFAFLVTEWVVLGNSPKSPYIPKSPSNIVIPCRYPRECWENQTAIFWPLLLFPLLILLQFPFHFQVRPRVCVQKTYKYIHLGFWFQELLPLPLLFEAKGRKAFIHCSPLFCFLKSPAKSDLQQIPK